MESGFSLQVTLSPGQTSGMYRTISCRSQKDFLDVQLVVLFSGAVGETCQCPHCGALAGEGTALPVTLCSWPLSLWNSFTLAAP